MADISHLSSCNYLQCFSSLHTVQPAVAPNRNYFKKAAKFVDSAALSIVSVAHLSSKPKKRGPSLKPYAAVAEATDQPKWWEKNAGPNMIDIHSTEEFLSALSEAGDRLVIVEFYGTWCASCRALFPRLCRMAEGHPEILFLKVNFDENKAMCKSMKVKVLPYFHFYCGAEGKVDDFSCSLAKFQKLKDAIEMHNPTCNNSAAETVSDPRRNLSSNAEDKSAESSNT